MHVLMGWALLTTCKEMLDFKSSKILEQCFSASLYKNLITHLLMKNGNTI